MTQKTVDEIVEEFKIDYANEVYRVNGGEIEGFTGGFVKWLSKTLIQYRKDTIQEVLKIGDSLKRTDETQMSDDHIYDEAIDNYQDRIQALLDNK